MKSLLFALAGLAAAQSAIELPVVAHILDAKNRLTPIFGLPGNFYSGPPGITLLSYSNDGITEWRLESGSLTISHAGRSAQFGTSSIRAEFRGLTAVLADPTEIMRYDGMSLLPDAGSAEKTIAGRTIVWESGRLRVMQSDGSMEELICPVAPDQLTAAAAHWAHARISGDSHLIDLRRGRVQMYILPGRGDE